MRTANQIAAEMLKSRPMTFRNNCGMAIDKNGNKIRFGLYPGSSDRIGWVSTVITSDMIGGKIAIFASCEIKTITDKISDKQKRWNKAVIVDGGICEIWTENKDGDIITLTGKDII